MRRTPLLAALTLAAAGPAAAASLSDTVPGHPGVTSFDLAKLVVTDLASTSDGAKGTKVVRFRHIEGKAMLAPPEDQIVLGDDAVSVTAIPGQPVRVLALIDLGASDGNVEEAEVLGLFAFSPRPRLLDLVEVGNDRWTAMAEHPPLLARGAPLIQIDSDHWNSNQTYNDTELIFIRAGRFQLIDSFFTYSEQVCGWQRTQEATYGTAPAKRAYRNVTVAVRDETRLTGDDCGDDKLPRASLKTYAGTYTWDAAHGRYVTRSKPLKTLAALNAKWIQSGGD